MGNGLKEAYFIWLFHNIDFLASVAAFAACKLPLINITSVPKSLLTQGMSSWNCPKRGLFYSFFSSKHKGDLSAQSLTPPCQFATVNVPVCQFNIGLNFKCFVCNKFETFFSRHLFSILTFKLLLSTEDNICISLLFDRQYRWSTTKIYLKNIIICWNE